MIIRKTAVLVVVCWLAASAGWPQGISPEVVPLKVRVVDEAGRPLANVVVTVLGAGPAWSREGTLLGELPLELLEGVYDLAFSHPLHYDLVVKEVEISLPEDPSMRAEPGPVTIMMQRRRELEPARMGESRHVAAPPPLAVSFEPEGNLFQGHRARGAFRLTNQGDAPLLVPLARAYRWTRETLVLGLQVSIPGSGVAFDENFLCVPPEDCHELLPGRSIEIQVVLNSAMSSSAGRSDPAAWEAAGDFKGNAQVYFILPQGGSEVPIYTLPVEASFQVTIREDY